MRSASLLLKRQFLRCGAITVTDKRIILYFVSFSEAS